MRGRHLDDCGINIDDAGIPVYDEGEPVDALAAGVHPKVVSARLGHSTVSMTLDVYSHAVPALEEQAATVIAGLLDLGAGAAR